MIVSLACLTCSISLVSDTGLPREACENFWKGHYKHMMLGVRVGESHARVDDDIEPEVTTAVEDTHVPGTCGGCGQKSDDDPCRICGRSRSKHEDVFVGKVRIR